jgi:NAD(P)-dependent dehydrogenase (short-subunit alcohol dehydrogenase family)
VAILITGGAGGLGQACAKLAAERGQDLALIDIADSVNDVARDLRSSGTKAAAAVCDWAVVDEVAEAWKSMESEVGSIDVILNCAGVYKPKPVLEITTEDWDFALRTNLTAPFFVCQLAAKIWIDRGVAGSVVNVASTAALGAGFYEATAYGSAKAGLLGATMHLAQKLGPHGIRVNAVAPGSFVSPMTAQRLSDPSEVARTTERIPMGRIGQVDEVAATILHLGLDASFVTGVVVPVDGGLLTTL